MENRNETLGVHLQRFVLLNEEHLQKYQTLKEVVQYWYRLKSCC